MENELIATKEIEQSESLKLVKNAKGNYQWEIRILSLDVDKIESLNKDMIKRFGVNNEEN